MTKSDKTKQNNCYETSTEVFISNMSVLKYPEIEGDAGYDLIASSDPKIVGNTYQGFYTDIEYIEYEIDLRIKPPKGLHTYIFPRSSISTKNLVLANSIGLIDNGYRGLVKVRFKYIFQPSDYEIVDFNVLATPNMSRIYKKGDKIAQLVFSKTELPLLFKEEIDEKETKRAGGGFGSTGL